ncbi:hypothetical protein BGW42_000375 [Actinomortierella wolfii]|nr:hypothetical protein BGW42_000375 [Actinomortierella wolfii]
MTLVLGDFLGRGNIGKVFKAEWNGQCVAAKQFTLRGEDTLIEEEIKIHREFAHANVIKMLGLESYDQTMVMIMEYCENGSLKAALQGRLILDWHAKTRIAREAASGLAYLHSKGVLHRDLRSGNVLLDANVSVRLTDFGIPRIKTTTAAKAHGQRGEGTLRWMAPELLSIKPKYSNKSDVYALAMVMWEMASEKVLPYKEEENNGFITEFVKGGGREKVPEGTPEDYTKWILRCWEQDPEKRPEASEMESCVAIIPVLDPANPTGAKAPWGVENGRKKRESEDTSAEGGDEAKPRPRVRFSDKPPAERVISFVEVEIEDNGKDDDDDDEDEIGYGLLSSSFSSEKMARLDIGKARMELTKKQAAKDEGNKKSEVSSSSLSAPTPASAPTMSLRAAAALNVESPLPSPTSTRVPSATSKQAEIDAAKHAKAEDLYRRAVEHTGEDRSSLSRLRESAELGYAPAQNDLGWMYHKGIGMEKNDEHGYYWVRKAAKQGHAQAQFRLAIFYGTGKGVPPNPHKAFEYYRKSAENGHIDGQATIGYMYQNGIVTARDYTKAMKWSLKAAEQGSANGQYDVGALYEKGLGVPADLNKALEWYRKAARKGHDQANKKVQELTPLLSGGRRRIPDGPFPPGQHKAFMPNIVNPMSMSRPKKPTNRSGGSQMAFQEHHISPPMVGSSSWSGPQAPTAIDDYPAGTDYAKIQHSLYEPDKKMHNLMNQNAKK